MLASKLARMRISSSLGALCISLSAVCSGPALAQEAPPASDVTEEGESEEDRIVVTGSRIARPELNSAAPVTAVSSEQLTLSGNTGAGDIIQYIPALFSSVSSDLSATRAGIFGGTALNLRDLGAARTLVLVNGRRHVAGSSGTAIVDVETIPTALIDRIDVLTGGASSVYGSDAVSGVVNYVLKRDLDGLIIDGQAGISERGDAGDYFMSGAYGRNFADGRGNISLAVQYSRGEALSYGDRDYLRGGQRLDDDANPALRFQAGDINPALAALGAIPGQTILRANGTPRYAGTPQSLIDRARTAAPRAFLPGRNFSISSALGVIGFDADGDFVADDPGTDFDRNGVNDCDQTYNFAITGFGCYVTDNGRVRPFRDGLIAGFANSFGGDGILAFLDKENVVPQTEQINANLNARFEVSNAFQPFVESKFVRTKASDINNVNSFNDTIPIRLDNPFIPAELRTAIDAFYLANPALDPADGQILLSRDNTDFGQNRRRVERDTYRIVVGAEGEFAANWRYEISGNYGRTEETTINDNVRLEDRFYAAVDAVRNGSGQIVCRSSLNPNTIPGTSPFPAYDADPDGDGVFEPDTFRTNDGTCRPLNLFGLGAPSAEAVAFVNPPSESGVTLEQIVAQAFIAGTTEGFFRLPGGAPGIVIGGEYRKEKSRFEVDPFDQAGFFFESGTQPETGEFDVKEVFGELELPFFADVPFADLLTVKGSARYSDYSLENVGGVFTWAVDGIYRPIPDITVRGSYAKAVRAPNITNLFSPTTPATFRPIDPCDAAQITRGPNPAVREANCRADGIPAGFTDPLTARITGLTGGNPNLEEERSTSWTVGGVLQPSFLPGFTLTVDYWNYEITNAIANVSADEIASGCYDSPDFPDNSFCALFTRNRTVGSPTFLGFNSFRNGPVNFARFEAQGIDFQARYRFPLGGDAGFVTARVAGTYALKNTTFTSVTDPNSEDDFIGEAQRPEVAFNTGLAWEIGPARIEWESFWQSKQYYQGIDVEDPGGFAEPNRDDDFWSHDLNFAYDVTEELTFRAGVNNLTDERPFAAEAAYPISAIGRNYFIGFRAKY